MPAKRSSATSQSTREAILEVSNQLFQRQGFAKTTIADILRALSISKGAFYHHFASKEILLDAIVSRQVAVGVVNAKKILHDDTLGTTEALLAIILAQQEAGNDALIEAMHQVENAQMHQKCLQELVTQMTPILTELVERGVALGEFHTPYPQETIELILVAAQCLFDDGLFTWDEADRQRKIRAFLHNMELLLGATSGSLALMLAAFREGGET